MAEPTRQSELEGFFASVLPQFFEYVRLHATAVNTIERVSSLDGIDALPAYMELGGVEKTVLVPLELLTANVSQLTADCRAATITANNAAVAADSAVERLQVIVATIGDERAAVEAAIETAETAASGADTAAEACQSAMQECIEATGSASEAAANANDALATCRRATIDAQDAAGRAEAAAISAEQAAQRVTDSITQITSLKQQAEQATADASTAAGNASRSALEADAAKVAIEQRESERISAETDRGEAELARQQNEQARISAERGRGEAELARAGAETDRDNAELARQQAEFARQQAETGRSTAELARASAETGRDNAERARVAEFADMKGASETATALALEVAAHPTLAGSDGYMYEWDTATKTYTKTDKYVRGKDFTVTKTFDSVAEMLAYDGGGLTEGDFVLINTEDTEDTDNAKIYSVLADGSYRFLVDMSGARGFTGKTPQVSIGTVTTLQPGTPASAALTANGTDAAGNPQYLLSFGIPKGDTFVYDDLTAADKDDLTAGLRGIIDDWLTAGGRLLGDWQQAETARGQAETEREQAYRDMLALQEAVAAHPARINAAGEWEVYDLDDDAYIPTGATAVAHSPQLVSGIWFTYDDTLGQYRSTGISASSDYELTLEKINHVLYGDVSDVQGCHNHDARTQRMVSDMLTDYATLDALREAIRTVDVSEQLANYQPKGDYVLASQVIDVVDETIADWLDTADIIDDSE